MDRSYSGFASAAGTATLYIVPDKAGIQWAIAQFSVDSSPSRPQGTATVRKNGLYVTSTQTLPQSASGAPAILLQPMDTLTVDFTGLTLLDNAIATVFFTETPWGYLPQVGVV